MAMNALEGVDHDWNYNDHNPGAMREFGNQED
jgi:hypothetical protein